MLAGYFAQAHHAPRLRSMTEGRASFTMEFDHYEVVPPNVSATIVASRQ